MKSQPSPFFSPMTTDDDSPSMLTGCASLRRTSVITCFE